MSTIAPFAGWTSATPYGIVLVVAASLCAISAVASWRRRPLPGATSGMVVMAAAAIWALFYSFELTAGDLAGKVLWAKAQYLGIAPLPVAWFIFALNYTVSGRLARRWWLYLLYLVPLTTVVLVATNDLHALVWTDVSLVTTGPFVYLALAHGTWFWVAWGYSNLFMCLGTLLLLLCAYRYERPRLYRGQIVLVVLAAATPWIGNLLYVTRLLPYGGLLDPTPLAFAVATLLLALSMSRFRLLSLQPTLLPVARGQLLEQMNDGVLVLDSDQRIALANPAVCSMLGQSAEDLLGRRLAELPGDLSMRLGRSPARAEKQRFGVTLGAGPKSRVYDVGVTAIGHKVGGGRPTVGHLLVLRDMTEQKRAEAALRQSEERFKELSSMASEAMMVHEDGLIVDANAAFARGTGHRSVDEVIGRSVLEVVPFTEESREAAQASLLTRPNNSYEVQYFGPDGDILWAEVRASNVTYRGRSARLVLMTDVSERKRAEEALRDSMEQLRQSQKTEAVGRLAGGVAHDFNNMLGVILGHSEVALAQVSPTSPIYRDLQEISGAARRSAGITQQLLGFARQQMAVPVSLDLNAAVEGMLHMLDRLVGEDVELVWRPGEGLGMVVIDPSQIDQILVNLCVNARDAITSVGSVVIETAVSSSEESTREGHPGHESGEYVRLSITDTGSGMQPEVLEHVFDPFFTTKEPGKGTGLGMATVYGIVKQNDGHIEVTSGPDEGTRIDVYLPRRTAEEANDRESVSRDAAAVGEEALLVVEDEVSLLRLSERVLKSLGYTVFAASTPSEAIRLAETQGEKLSLVITDVIMPEMDGRELVERLNSVQPGLRALFISGYAAEAISDRGIMKQEVFFLQKPYTPQELADHVRAALEAD